ESARVMFAVSLSSRVAALASLLRHTALRVMATSGRRVCNRFRIQCVGYLLMRTNVPALRRWACDPRRAVFGATCRDDGLTQIGLALYCVMAVLARVALIKE